MNKVKDTDSKTVLALHLACQLGLKTLVVVHKTFLQNQWYDRIKQFTDAMVGTIRQKKVDVKNKDIVVGMLQSISMIDYDSSIFEDFGCVIFDECHHCASRVFSNALYKLGAKYMIGLSATPFRADGLTKVLYWYMGDIIYRLTRKTDNIAYVKFINYEAKNRFFVEKKQWVKGKIRPAVVKMVTNICKADPRNQFLIDAIDHLKGLYERKILILSGRLDHLRILKEGVDALIKEQEEQGLIDKNEFTTSYYIGKMKAGQLEVASEADIIFATYAMAEEGLDIDKLNTLVLATPKLNVEQSVGRIMRKQIKEGDTPPLIMDIVDQLSSFERWGEVRRKFYTKNKYNIEFYQAFNDHFVGMKEYMYLRKMITKKQFNDENLDVRKEYIISQFGEDHYEIEEETGFEDDPIEKYTVNPTLKSVFKISATIYKEDDEIPDEDNLIMQGRLKMK